MKIVSIISILLMSLSFTTFSQTVTIGTQVWMTKNLDVSSFKNGDTIPYATTDVEWRNAGENRQPAWCYYDNDPKNGTKYGKLYNWFAVSDSRGLAPDGYHIPTDAEWTQLIDYLGGEKKATKKLKSSSGWTSKGNGTNKSGFNGLPGGCRIIPGVFSSLTLAGVWWSASEYASDAAYYRGLYFYNADLLGRTGNVKMNGFSVRCVKD
jgi:uncharacterized protein (TIGR02145 family)